MEVLLLTVFVSLVLAGLGVGLFVWTVRSKTFEHADRLAILPLELAEQETESAVPGIESSSRRAVREAVDVVEV
ncbi:MAG: cbb3-type cytochrome oxidase assembly protein CcoS [Deltaproteobacteria bacterium]|nr:cbb3-type cytochrome oxidase assembly protein CcoS [Deltaproteobacteria bacterium]